MLPFADSHKVCSEELTEFHLRQSQVRSEGEHLPWSHKRNDKPIIKMLLPMPIELQLPVSGRQWRVVLGCRRCSRIP